MNDEQKQKAHKLLIDHLKRDLLGLIECLSSEVDTNFMSCIHSDVSDIQNIVDEIINLQVEYYDLYPSEEVTHDDIPF